MAGEFTININRSVVIGGVTFGGVNNSVFADNENVLSKTVPASTTNGEFDFTVTIANVQVIACHANQDCTVLVNSTGAPTETLNLKKNQLLMWNAGSDPAGSKFITHDITKIYVTTGANDTVFLFGAGVDSTPVLTP